MSAAQTLALHPSSKIAKENLEVFCEAWESQLCDMALLVREINDVFEGRRGVCGFLFFSLINDACVHLVELV